MEKHTSTAEAAMKALGNNLTTGLLIAAAFTIGVLFTEVRYLKKGSPSAGTAPSAVADAGAAPAGPTETLQKYTKDQLAKVPEVTNDDHIRGNKNAAITLVEYSDFECPFCQRYIATLDQIMEEYGDKVRIVFRHYPLSFHQFAQKAAEASECVAEQSGNDAFWKFHDLYFAKTLANGTGYPQEKLADLAAEAGAGNKEAFQNCLDSDQMAQKVKDQMAAGLAAGVQGTPGTFLITKDGEGGMISGAVPFESIKAVLDEYVK